MSEYSNFFELQGQIIRAISVAEGNRDVLITTDQFVYVIDHAQDCCENVRVFKIQGDENLILNRPILLAEEDNVAPEVVDPNYCFDSSYTWTKFILQTEAGQFIFWFLGESNGYYSESVNVTKRDI
jgi:hypothetical protein